MGVLLMRGVWGRIEPDGLFWGDLRGERLYFLISTLKAHIWRGIGLCGPRSGDRPLVAVQKQFWPYASDGFHNTDAGGFVRVESRSHTSI